MTVRVFIDANISVSVINKEMNSFYHTSRIFSLIDLKKISGYSSPICVAIAAYFASKKLGQREARLRIKSHCSKLNLLSITPKTVMLCLNDKRINDIEDGIEYYAAKEDNIQYIITMDAKDFYFSDIPVFTPQEFLSHYVAGDI